MKHELKIYVGLPLFCIALLQPGLWFKIDFFITLSYTIFFFGLLSMVTLLVLEEFFKIILKPSEAKA